MAGLENPVEELIVENKQMSEAFCNSLFLALSGGFQDAYTYNLSLIHIFAGEYLDEIQKNRARLESINQTIKKYNQALLYCHQDSRDMAIIQLKKVLSMNPKMVQGHQLLGLLYLDVYKRQR